MTARCAIGWWPADLSRCEPCAWRWCESASYDRGGPYAYGDSTEERRRMSGLCPPGRDEGRR